MKVNLGKKFDFLVDHIERRKLYSIFDSIFRRALEPFLPPKISDEKNWLQASWVDTIRCDVNREWESLGMANRKISRFPIFTHKNDFQFYFYIISFPQSKIFHVRVHHEPENGEEKIDVK